MKNIQELNEKLLFEVSKEKDDKKSKKDKKDDELEDFGSLSSKEYRNTLQAYKGRIAGTSNIDVDFKKLKSDLSDKVSGISWTTQNVKKTFDVITKMIGVQPEEEE